MSDSQYGSREGRSISQAAIRLTTFIIKGFHHKQYSTCFFLDLRKAFDTIDHAILLRKLSNSGFRGPIFNYLSSYVSNRKQYILIGNDKSEELDIGMGVPQGSMIGPELFNIFINDIVKAIDDDVEVILFADDAAFYVSASSLILLYAKMRSLFS